MPKRQWQERIRLSDSHCTFKQVLKAILGGSAMGVRMKGDLRGRASFYYLKTANCTQTFSRNTI